MDKILEDINAFGRYQKIAVAVIGAMSSLNAMAIFATGKNAIKNSSARKIS